MTCSQREEKSQRVLGNSRAEGYLNPSCEPPTATGRIIVVPQWASCLVLGEQK